MNTSVGKILQILCKEKRVCCQLYSLMHQRLLWTATVHATKVWHQTCMPSSRWPGAALRPLHPLVDVTRGYSKRGKESKKDKKSKKGSKPRVSLSAEEISEVMDNEKFIHQLNQAVDHLRLEYIEQLKLRTSAGVFDQLMVDTEDGKFPLIQLGQVANKNPQLIVVNLATAPQYIPAVKEAIVNSGMNLNPQQDGTTLFVPIPKVTREHRELLARNAKTLCDKTKDKIRDIQKRFIRDVKKGKDNHSEDLLHNVQEMIHLTTQEYMGQAESLMEAKQQEILNK